MFAPGPFTPEKRPRLLVPLGGVGGAVLLTLGVRFSSALLRWQGLVLFAIVTLKVFVADLSFLRGVYRSSSSIALGVVLIVISYRSQRWLARGKV